MRTQQGILLIALFLLALRCDAIAPESDTIPADTDNSITWRVVDWPPFYILRGEHKGEGLFDQIIRRLHQQMPEYQHNMANMNTDRALYEIKIGRHVCHPSALAGTLGQLSFVNAILLPHRIIILKENASRFHQYINNDAISLTDLLQDSSIKAGLTSGRYSQHINTIIKPYEKGKNIYDSKNYSGLIQMLFNNRVDFIIEYSPAVEYEKQRLNNRSEYQSYTISETADIQFLPVYIACPDTDWGKKVISQINHLLAEEAKHSDLIDNRLKWYDDNSKKILREAYQNVYFLDKALLSQ